jgi:hypothetical protein
VGKLIGRTRLLPRTKHVAPHQETRQDASRLNHRRLQHIELSMNASDTTDEEPEHSDPRNWKTIPSFHPLPEIHQFLCLPWSLHHLRLGKNLHSETTCTLLGAENTAARKVSAPVPRRSSVNVSQHLSAEVNASPGHQKKPLNALTSCRAT